MAKTSKYGGQLPPLNVTKELELALKKEANSSGRTLSGWIRWILVNRKKIKDL